MEKVQWICTLLPKIPYFRQSWTLILMSVFRGLPMPILLYVARNTFHLTVHTREFLNLHTVSRKIWNTSEQRRRPQQRSRDYCQGSRRRYSRKMSLPPIRRGNSCLRLLRRHRAPLPTYRDSPNRCHESYLPRSHRISHPYPSGRIPTRPLP